jgi:hypothetical protein
MVMAYTRRQLTFASDKLPALAGLADAFRRNGNLGVYLMGMWSHSIERDIAWQSWGNGTPLDRLVEIPSWSWASAGDRRIEWPELHFFDWYCVKPVVCTQHALEPLHAHILEFSGFVLRLSLQLYAERSGIERHNDLGRRVYVTSNDRRHSVPQLQNIQATTRLIPIFNGYAGFKSTELSQTMEESVSTLNWGYFNADRSFWADEEELQQELQHVFYLPIGTDLFHKSSTRTWGVESCYVVGIVLRSVDREGPSSDRLCRYERIGWLSYEVLKDHTEWRPEGFRSRFLVV